jgi:hypothetical protein
LSAVNPVSRVERKVKLEELGKMVRGIYEQINGPSIPLFMLVQDAAYFFLFFVA